MVSTPLLCERNARIDGDPGSANDTALVWAAQSGDSLAFIELCERHSKKLLRRLHRITRNWQDAEDALQDTLLSAYRNLNRFENRSAFSSWLTAIAINSGLMTLRRKHGIAVPLDEAFDFSPGPDSGGARQRSIDPESHYERREEHLLLARAIRRLPPLLRVVIELRILEDCSLEEIARDLGISQSAVKSRLARARARLRKSLTGEAGLFPGAEHRHITLKCHREWLGEMRLRRSI